VVASHRCRWATAFFRVGPFTRCLRVVCLPMPCRVFPASQYDRRMVTSSILFLLSRPPPSPPRFYILRSFTVQFTPCLKSNKPRILPVMSNGLGCNLKPDADSSLEFLLSGWLDSSRSVGDRWMLVLAGWFSCLGTFLRYLPLWITNNTVFVGPHTSK